MPQGKESSSAVLPNLDASTKVAARLAKEPQHTPKYQGLCSNCDLRETCLYVRPGTAVWFCEEYQ